MIVGFVMNNIWSTEWMLFNSLQDTPHFGGSSIHSDQFQFQVIILGVEDDWCCKNNLQWVTNFL